MKKIRIGNDFVFAWEIERNGLPEDLSSVLEKHLYLLVFDKRVELIEGVDYDIIGNVIRIEVTPAIANIIGTYKAEFHYILPDDGLIDDDRKCAVDVDAFKIVAKTAQADDSTEFSMTSDMAIAFKGDKGDSAYEVWLKDNPGKTKEDYFNWLQKPATDIAETVNLQEQARVEAEELRVLAEQDRHANTQEAISNAEDATENANTAAQNANDARDNIMPSVLNNEKVQADIYAQLNARITALEAIISNKIKDRIEVTKEFNVWGKTNLILYGNGANTKAPDFIGQKYIDTTNSNVYIAVGTSNAGNWKLV